MMNTVIRVPADVFAEAGRGAEKLRAIAAKLQHAESILLAGFAAAFRLSGEQVDFMAQAGQSFRQAAHRFARSAVALFETGNDLAELHESVEQLDYGTTDDETTRPQAAGLLAMDYKTAGPMVSRAMPMTI